MPVALLYFDYFRESVLPFACNGLNHDLPILCFLQSLGRQVHATMISFLSIEMGSNKIPVCLACNCDPPNLSFPII
jgi:hypothetical protein